MRNHGYASPLQLAETTMGRHCSFIWPASICTPLRKSGNKDWLMGKLLSTALPLWEASPLRQVKSLSGTARQWYEKHSMSSAWLRAAYG